MKKTNRHLKVTISEVVDMHLGEDEEDNPAFRGVLSMPTKLEVKYDRRVKGGSKCKDPLNPVYVDSLVEALSYMMALTVNKPEDVPILANMVFGHLSKRLQTYAGSRFPDLYTRLQQQAGTMISGKSNVAERKLAFLEHFTAQLNGEEAPCKVCTKECEFKGQFEKE